MKNNSVSLNRIKLLPKELAAKIAAGEVIERPLSIVKELVENSIDAASDLITVEIRKGGKEYIRVTDNGQGIEKDQLELAFKRHASSKISSEEDLDHISSLGFRGEALASIAEVSHTEMISKPANCKIGAKIIIDGGEVSSVSDSACEDGTTIIIKDVFYNLPARLKFMKSDNTESSLIADFLQKIALAYPYVRFRFINNGSIIFSTPGKNNLYETILSLYSPKIAKTLVEINYSHAGLRLYGYCSGISEGQNNKKQQVYFVNGRLIKSKIIDSAIAESYHDKLFEGKYPACFIFLEIDPSEIDVNIHPSKAEIKFYDESLVKDFIILAIRNALKTKEAAPDVAIHKNKDIKLDVNTDKFNALIRDNNNNEESRLENWLVNNNIFLSVGNDEEFFKDLREEQQSIEIPIIKVSDDLKKELAKPNRFLFSTLKPIAQIFTTYILATDDKCLYIVDQHAAHERIMYEKLLSKFNGEENLSQILIAPILMHISPKQAVIVDAYIDLLASIGFVSECFGPKELLIKEIPASLKLDEAEEFVHTILDSDVDNAKSLQEKKDAIISASCKAAVKSGDKLSELEISSLFHDLDNCDNPFSCPHGRPTFLRFSESEIEHFFKRK